MNLDWIFNVFSKRQQPAKAVVRPLTEGFRNRVLMLCRDTFSANVDRSHADYTEEFWTDIHTKLQYLHGRPQLSNAHATTQREDAFAFLIRCTDVDFLDFVELIFKFELLWKVCQDENQLIPEVNRLFQIDDLPYALTGFVRQKERGYFFGRETEVERIVVYPQVIHRENQVEYANLVEPVLTLLNDETFTSANCEFLEALADYRKGDYGDCLSKCGNSFESVMKVICDRKEWPYKQSDTASKLLRTVLSNTRLDSFFEQPLLVIGTLRNHLSKSHGAGTMQREVPKNVARFAVNATASAILLLVDETTP